MGFSEQRLSRIMNGVKKKLIPAAVLHANGLSKTHPKRNNYRVVKLQAQASKQICHNRYCRRKLVGPIKILENGAGEEFPICLPCFKDWSAKNAPVSGS